jgi:spore photoproduct lyase
LTKTANTHYLADIIPAHRANIVASFSLNPESIADMWEGKWPDTGERITPSISKRLEAIKYAQDLGFEVRVRVDPILTPHGWEEHYAAFIAEVKSMGINFRYWTLGTYRDSVEYASVLFILIYCYYMACSVGLVEEVCI